MDITLTVSCCLCGEEHETELTLPDGWALRYSGIDEESGFCPKHSIISEWAASQCPGCVGGWKDCGLWTDFAFRKRGLSEHDLDAIRHGICPRRVNGSFMCGPEGFREFDMSEQATTASGEALAQAILDYWNKYGTEPTK